MKTVTRDSWKSTPMAQQHKPLDFTASYVKADAELILAGHRPQGMDDKWFIYAEGDCLFFHRSWTGLCVYRIRFACESSVLRIVDSVVTCEKYDPKDLEYERKLLAFLIDSILLKKSATFPLPADAVKFPKGAYQHSIAGSGYPEAPHRPGFWQRIRNFLT
jgi:hypothetical protein